MRNLLSLTLHTIVFFEYWIRIECLLDVIRICLLCIINMTLMVFLNWFLFMRVVLFLLIGMFSNICRFCHFYFGFFKIMWDNLVFIDFTDRKWIRRSNSWFLDLFSFFFDDSRKIGSLLFLIICKTTWYSRWCCLISHPRNIWISISCLKCFLGNSRKLLWRYKSLANLWRR